MANKKASNHTAMSGSNVRLRSPVDYPVYVRFSSAQKFTVQVAHYFKAISKIGSNAMHTIVSSLVKNISVLN